MSHMKQVAEIAGYVVAVILLFMVLVLMLGLVGTPFMILDCKSQAEKMEMPWRYNFWSGCFLQIDDGSWIRDDYYIVPELK